MSVIDSIVSPIGTAYTAPLDSLPWFWSIERPEKDIYAIRLAYTGSAGSVRLAFDNFSPLAVENSEPEHNTSVPEPTSAIGPLVFATVAYSLRKSK